MAERVTALCLIRHPRGFTFSVSSMASAQDCLQFFNLCCVCLSTVSRSHHIPYAVTFYSSDVRVFGSVLSRLLCAFSCNLTRFSAVQGFNNPPRLARGTARRVNINYFRVGP